jgi:hypothetical protein
MDRQQSAGYFEVRRTSALMERPLLAAGSTGRRNTLQRDEPKALTLLS